MGFLTSNGRTCTLFPTATVEPQVGARVVDLQKVLCFVPFIESKAIPLLPDVEY
jgi:hypothetical protein